MSDYGLICGGDEHIVLSTQYSVHMLLLCARLLSFIIAAACASVSQRIPDEH